MGAIAPCFPPPQRKTAPDNIFESWSIVPDGQPLASRTVAEREDLWCEVVLLQLTSFTQVPWTHRVIEPSSPQLGAVRCYVYAAGAVRVTLKLSVNADHNTAAQNGTQNTKKYLQLNYNHRIHLNVMPRKADTKTSNEISY